jgi:hypothetical protein
LPSKGEFACLKIPEVNPITRSDWAQGKSQSSKTKRKFTRKLGPSETITLEQWRAFGQPKLEDLGYKTRRLAPAKKRRASA